MYRGHIQNGVVVFDDQVRLLDGVRVEVSVLEHSDDGGTSASLLERLGPVVGAAQGLPSDLAEKYSGGR